MREDNIPIFSNTVEDPLPIDKWVESWRIQIWDQGFMSFFRRKDGFSKTKAFKEYKFVDLVVKRELFR
jgi:hypothetical protein